jgi:hypothetical protein
VSAAKLKLVVSPSGWDSGFWNLSTWFLDV